MYYFRRVYFVYSFRDYIIFQGGYGQPNMLTIAPSHLLSKTRTAPIFKPLRHIISRHMVLISHIEFLV
jgi:hypothetical protein